MAKILLDEFFYQRDNVDVYIYDVINFISQYFGVDIALFHPYCNMGNLWMLQNEIAAIERKIIKTGKYYICDTNLVQPNNNIKLTKLGYTPEFIGKINFIINNFDDVIIFNAPEKHSFHDNQPFEHVYIINHITKETDSNIARFIVNGLFMTNINSPCLSSPLPNTDLCKDYLGVLREKCEGEAQNTCIPFYINIGTEVVKRNKYVYSARVTNLNNNSGAIRNIFCNSENGDSVYASIDIENGAIEINNHRGKHQDEYTYNNIPQNKQDKTGKHDIKV